MSKRTTSDNNPLTLDEARTLARTIRSGRKFDRGYAAWVVEQLCNSIEGRPNQLDKGICLGGFSQQGKDVLPC